MKGEIRGLKTGSYWSEDDTALLRIRRVDDGVTVEIADLDADIFYEFVVDEEGIVTFTWGQASPINGD